jgi:hypothetical protein
MAVIGHLQSFLSGCFVAVRYEGRVFRLWAVDYLLLLFSLGRLRRSNAACQSSCHDGNPR